MADLLRGDYKQSDYGKVILPFTVLRRLDCVLEPTKPAVLAELAARQKAKLNPEPFLLRKSGHFFQYLAAGHEKTDGELEIAANVLRGDVESGDSNAPGTVAGTFAGDELFQCARPGGGDKPLLSELPVASGGRGPRP